MQAERRHWHTAELQTSRKRKKNKAKRRMDGNIRVTLFAVRTRRGGVCVTRVKEDAFVPERKNGREDPAGNCREGCFPKDGRNAVAESARRRARASVSLARFFFLFSFFINPSYIFFVQKGCFFSPAASL